MKRDLDLIREILLDIETHHTNKATSAPEVGLNFKVEGHSDEAAAYHLTMLIDAGYVLGQKTSMANMVMVKGLTMTGHDYLDSIRDAEIWRKTKEGAHKAGGFTLEILGDLAKGIIKTQIKKHTGIEV